MYHECSSCQAYERYPELHALRFHNSPLLEMNRITKQKDCTNHYYVQNYPTDLWKQNALDHRDHLPKNVAVSRPAVYTSVNPIKCTIHHLRLRNPHCLVILMVSPPLKLYTCPN
jgi:hypothetical protein